MVRRGARLHRHHAPRQFGEERDEPAARWLARYNDRARRIDGVNLNAFVARSSPARVTAVTFRINLPMDGFPSDGLMTTTILAR